MGGISNRKLVQGVGINDADYQTTWNGANGKRESCPIYIRWSNMLSRCYSKARQEKISTYTGCSVCTEWLSFMNFKSWVDTQDWVGNHLDKDLLIPGNKVYSPDTCVFVTPLTNIFITNSEKARGEYPIGVHVVRKKGTTRYRANIGSGRKGKREHLGYFDTAEEAHTAWRKEKYKQAVKLAYDQSDKRVAQALIKRYYIAQN